MDGHRVFGNVRSAHRKGRLTRRRLLSGLAMLQVLPPLLSGTNAAAQQASSGFSFAVCGDSRPMMYLPVKEGRPDLVGLFVEMFGLVMPDKVAEEVVKRDVKMIFDPTTNELSQVVMPFMSRSEVMTLSFDQGLGDPCNCRRRETASWSTPGDFPTPGRRLGLSRNRAAGAGWAR